jgi:hypothetical protein
MQFILGELSVAVFVEFLERGRRVGDLFGRELAIVVRVEHLHQRIARRTAPASAAFRTAIGRALAFVFVFAARRTFRRLRDDGGCAQGTQNSDGPNHATHGLTPKLNASTGQILTFPRRRNTGPDSNAETTRCY